MRKRIPPFVGHEEYAVRRPSQSLVVLSFIEKACLGIGYLGRERDGKGVAFRIGRRPRFRHKGGESVPVFRKDIFKIDIHSLIAFLFHGKQQLCNQGIPDRLVIDQDGNQVIIKHAVRPEGRQGQDGSHVLQERRLNHEAFINRRGNKVPFRSKPVRKNG